MHPQFSELTPRWFKRAFVYTGSIGDFRYRFELPRNFSLYPILGPVFFHADDYNKLGVDIGLGFAYDINSHWAIGAEGKYQYVDDWDDAYLSFCASYKF